MQLYDPITSISGIGDKYAQMLEKLGIFTIEDLLMHVPFRYEDLSKVKKISELLAGETATIVGKVNKVDNVYTRYGKSFVKAIVEDETGKLEIIWFNQKYLKNALSVGSEVSLSGSLNPKSKKPQFTNPVWEVIKDGEALHTQGIIPVYPATEGLTSRWVRPKIKFVLDRAEIDEILPENVLKEKSLIHKHKAFEMIHFPEVQEEVELARKRLAFEELFFLHLKGLKHRKEWDSKKNGHKIKLIPTDLENFKNSLPFQLTKAQNDAIEDILDDLKRDVPMNRLLQGDVGSGKTAVAAAALLASLKSGFTSIYMAPTQILAQQHFETIKRLLGLTEDEVGLLTGQSRSGTVQQKKIIIGTHAILHQLDKFQNVGLVIIDEQHKFGVSQRTKVVDYFTGKKATNLLAMTATPIPRSLALTFYGDLDLSVIYELPVGRQIVKTWVTNESKRLAAYDWIKKEIHQNKTQVFIVCPFIEKSLVEDLENVKAAQEEFEKLKIHFKDFKLKLLHGRMKGSEKDEIIQDFAKGNFDILVTTPVIEVGIDIPNANIILIETPERFGLASLHQLRGRVGRGKNPAYCVLIPSTDAYPSIQRLKNLEKIHLGNKLAEIDLKLRGPGSMYGTEQHGFMDLKVADITDINLIVSTKETAKDIFDNLDQFHKIKEKLDRIESVEKN